MLMVIVDFIYYYAECRYDKRHYAECRYAKRHCAECLYAKRHYAECHGAPSIGFKKEIFNNPGIM